MQSFKNYEITTNKNIPPLLQRLVSAHFKGEEESLSEEDMIIMARWKHVRALSTQHRPCLSHTDIVNSLIKIFGITEAAAVTDIRNAQKLFGSIGPVNREFKRAVTSEWLEQLASLAEAKGDVKSAVAALGMQIKLLELDKPIGDEQEDVPRTFSVNLYFGSTNDLKVRTIDLDKIDQLQPTEFKELLRASDRPRIDLDTMRLLIAQQNEPKE